MPESESAVSFQCLGDQLIGVLHHGGVEAPLLIFVVGGPQYRVGSHRMFVDLARELSSNGLTILRFDCRGMGDSDGTFASFENLNDDICAAIDYAIGRTGKSSVVLLGLCDGASACAIYSESDPRVTGLVLLNPWVRTDRSKAKTQMTFYYRKRLFQPESWRQILTGQINVVRSLSSALGKLRTMTKSETAQENFITRMLNGLSRFTGSVLIILSSEDLTAQEFASVARTSEWQSVLERQRAKVVPMSSDHTFSNVEGISELASEILNYIRAN